MSEKNRARVDYIDWLRILAVFLLIYFHSARIFDDREPFYVKNAELSRALSALIIVIGAWQMQLFFLLSGAGSFFALGFRSGGQYAWERFKRLFIPLAFGTCVIVPPQAYYTLLGRPGFDKSYLAFLPQFFAFNPATAGGYRGTFEWAHLWFLAYLFTYSLLCIPLFLYLKKEGGKKLIDKVANFFERPGVIFLPALWLAVLEMSLRPKWPGFQVLVDDWANFTTYISYFIFGFIFCMDDRFAKTIGRQLKTIIALAIVCMLGVLAVEGIDPDIPAGYNPAHLLQLAFNAFTTWVWVIALLGLGGKFFNFKRWPLDYLNHAAFPFYVLHQTVIVVLGYYVIKLNTSVGLKYLIITTVALFTTLFIYDIFVRRTNITRFLFGMKPIKK
jgi:glucans biosynthesis protein C